MAGYRDSSGYDPWAYEKAGRPMRPYNWVQWIGVAFAAAGAIGAVAFLLGEAGFIPQVVGKSPAPFTTLPLIGLVLINSRREPGTLVGSEQLRRNRRMLLITIAAVAVILGAAITISAFKGA